MKKWIYGSLIAFLVSSCSGCQQELPEEALMSIRSNYAIDLFPRKEQNQQAEPTISYEQALIQSELGLLGTNVQKIDSSNTRGTSKFYLYKVSEGSIIKSPKSFTIPTSLHFIAQEDLFKTQLCKDSIYLFLKPLSDFQIIKKHTRIRYQWIDNAPIIIKK